VEAVRKWLSGLSPNAQQLLKDSEADYLRRERALRRTYQVGGAVAIALAIAAGFALHTAVKTKLALKEESILQKFSCTIIPKPFCEVVELLAPLRQHNDELGIGLNIQPSKGCRAIYLEGDPLVIDVSAQQPLHYVYVDDYIGDEVVHLRPNAEEPDDDALKTSKITLGGPPGRHQWIIQPPFGFDLFTVISRPSRFLQRHIFLQRLRGTIWYRCAKS
jgi:hypothetical protein